MDQVCQECKQKAEFICFCNDSYMCKGCREVHKKKYKGPHKILLCNDPDLEKIKISLKTGKSIDGKSGDTTPIEKPKPEDPPALVEEKNLMKTILNNEINLLNNFTDELIVTITDQAKTLIQNIVREYEKATTEFIDQCKTKEKAFTDSLDQLSTSEDISSNLLLCKLLDFPDLNSVELLNLNSVVTEQSISVENSLVFDIQFVKFEESNRVLKYFNENKESFIPAIKNLFEDVLNERHFTTSTIKLNKIILSKENAAQLSMILPQYPNVKILWLNENELGQDGIKVLGPALLQSNSLKKIIISKNALKGPGGKILASFLKEMKEIVSLDLSGNKFGSEGLKPICLALPNLSKLKTLKLMNNSLKSDSAGFLSSCLPALKKLKTLRLTGNSFDNEEQAIIEEHASNGCQIKF